MQVMTFEEAVAAHGRIVQVCSDEVKDGKRGQMIYSLTDEGAEQLAWRFVPAEQYDALVADLRERGLAVAEMEPPCDFIWVTSEQGIEVYGRDSKVLDATGDRATLHNRRVIPRADIKRVFAFAEPDYVWRGVKAELRVGGEIPLVTEVSMAADARAGYSRNDLLVETVWTAILGAAIAKWADASYDNQILG